MSVATDNAMNFLNPLRAFSGLRDRTGHQIKQMVTITNNFFNLGSKKSHSLLQFKT